MSLYRQTESRTLLSVGASALQKIDNFCHLKAPRCILPSVEVDQIKKVTKSIPMLANSLAEDEMFLWASGDGPTPTIEHTDVDVDFEYRGYSSKRIPLVALAENQISQQQFAKKRFGDAYRFLPLLTRRVLTVRERLFTTFLQSTTIHGAAQSFTNGPLDVPASNQAPLSQVDSYLRANMDPIQQMFGFQKVAAVNLSALETFRHHPEFIGRAVWQGAGDGKQFMSIEGVISIMKECWRLDDVWILDAIHTTAADGETDAIAHIAGSAGFLGIYLIKPGVTDLSTEKDSSETDYPDGAVVMLEPRVTGAQKAETRGINFDSYVNDETKMEYWRALHGCGFKAIRTSESGIDLSVIWDSITT